MRAAPDARAPQPGSPAPLHARLADGPGDGEARWIVAADGVALRAVAWGASAATRGTVLLFPGRTEYAEKYGRVARDLAARGWASLVIDWRGQGLSARLHPDRMLGHVGAFRDYQLDVAALVAHGAALGLPRPWMLLAHSMGGAIGLRALAEGLDVRAAAFSAPMWGIRMSPALRPVAWGVSSLSLAVGQSHRLAPGQERGTYLMRSGFEGNTLTTDRGTWDWMRAQVAAEPELSLGGPSLRWLNEALRELPRLMRMPPPPVPTLAAVGSDETVVEPGPIRERIATWPGARLLEVPGARHEVLMQAPAIRDRVLAEVLGLFAAQG